MKVAMAKFAQTLPQMEEMKVAVAVSKAEEEAKESADATLALTEHHRISCFTLRRMPAII